MSLYMTILLLSVAGPLILSFEKNLRFYKRWKFLFPAVLPVMAFFLIWDGIFVARGYWGFNPDYVGNFTIAGLPLEEILFFVIIPYASIFAFYAVKFHFPGFHTGNTLTLYLVVFLVCFSVTIISTSLNQHYTLVNFVIFVITLFFGYTFHRQTLGYFFAIFPVLLIPFIIVNGILTGTGIENEVVWYHPDIFKGKRLMTIPLEDFFYAFSLIFLVLMLLERFQMIIKKKHTG